MPNRYIRESAISSEPVNALSFEAEVFYRRLLNKVDDFGRYTASKPLLRAALFPLKLDSVSEAKIDKMLTETASVGLVFLYSDPSGKPLLVVNKWERGRAHKSAYAEPPQEVCERMQTYVYSRKQKFADAPDSDSDSDSVTDTDSDADNLAIYAEYPKKVGKQTALKAITKALKTITKEQLLERTRQYAAAVALWPESERQYVPHPATWFNRGSYDDDPEQWKRVDSAGSNGRALFA